jgi:transcriptional regulator with XRE-family HTH domain
MTKGRCHKALVKLLVAERKKAGITQVGLAKALKQHQSLIARLESGKRGIKIDEFVKLGAVIGFDAPLMLRIAMTTNIKSED